MKAILTQQQAQQAIGALLSAPLAKHMMIYYDGVGIQKHAHAVTVFEAFGRKENYPSIEAMQMRYAL